MLQPRFDLALGNWAQIVATGGAVPAAQTGPPTNTIVMALALMPQTSGVFFVSARLSWSCNTNALAVTHSLIAKQGAAAGAVTGGAAFAKFGQYATAGVVTSTGSVFNPNGQILNANAAGGGGLVFEGGALSAGNITLHTDVVATLTGLLTAQGLGTNNFEFAGIVDAGGATAAKTPWTIRQPVCFAVLLTLSAAGQVSYDSTMLFAQEQVTT